MKGTSSPEKTGSWGWSLRPVISKLGKTELQGLQVQGQLRQCSKSLHHMCNTNTNLAVFKNLLKDGIVFFSWETIQTGDLPTNLMVQISPPGSWRKRGTSSCMLSSDLHMCTHRQTHRQCKCNIFWFFVLRQSLTNNPG